VEEAFHTSIVITAAFRTHIATQVVSLQFEFELTKEWKAISGAVPAAYRHII
jgi:hypothetical protein